MELFTRLCKTYDLQTQSYAEAAQFFKMQTSLFKRKPLCLGP